MTTASPICRALVTSSFQGPGGDFAAGRFMELPDHPPGRLHGPPSRLRVGNVGGNFRRRGGGTAVQPLGLSVVSDEGVPDGLQALQVGGRLELPPQNPLAEVMPL